MKGYRELNNPTVLYIEARKDGKNPIVNPGSGFFVEDDLIVTNIHVVAGATSVFAKLIDPETNSVIKTFEIKGIRGFDGKNDLIILEAADKGIPLPIGNEKLIRSEDIVEVVGCPNQKYKTISGTLHSIRNSDKWLRMKVETIEGNSGGPVLNSKNEVVGIHSSKSEFCGYGIPSKVLRNLLIQLKLKEPLNLKCWSQEKVSEAYFRYIQAERKTTEMAISYLDKAIELYPDYTQFYSKLGGVKLSLGQSKVEVSVGEAQSYYKEAIDDYTKVLQVRGESAEAYNSRGYAKFLLGQSEVKQRNATKAQKHYKEAIEDQTDAIRLCSNYTPAYDCRANARDLLGKSEKDEAKSQSLYELVLSDRNIAIKQSPCCAEFYYKRSKIKATLCDFNGVIDDLKEAIRLKPHYTEACAALESTKETFEQEKKANVP